MVPKIKRAGNITSPALSRGVGRKGDERGVEVDLEGESITVSFASAAALAARRVVTIVNKRRVSLKRAKALGEVNDRLGERQKVSRKWRQIGLGRVFDDGTVGLRR